uniref:TFIIS N-terminal domain-containing protein n=1 Tax=Oryza punctata TaxID=4537 RepID=A0A0E0M6J6_ORYPU
MACGEAEAAVREMVRSMRAEQLDEAIGFATMELAGRDIPLEDMFRLCDEQDLRRANRPATGEIFGSGEEVENIKSKLKVGEDGRPSSDSSEKAVVELLHALQTVPMTFQTLEASKIGKTISGLRKHSSEQVRDLAAALYKNWKALVDEHLTRKPPALPTKNASALAAADRAKKANTPPAAHKPAPTVPRKKTASNRHEEAPALVDEAKLAAAKRKLQEGYEDTASAKKQRMIQVIDAPRTKVKSCRPLAVVEQRRITPAVAAVPPLRSMDV